MNQFTYRLSYGIGIILFLATLMNPLVEGFYVIAFFICTLALIITWQKVPEDITHSTITHYERYSRWNWFNYGMCIWLAICAVAMLIPLPRAWIVFIAWTATVFGAPIAYRFYKKTELSTLLTDYIKQQMPDLEVNVIKGLLAKMLGDPGFSNKKLAKLFATDEASVGKIRHYIEVYLGNNY